MSMSMSDVDRLRRREDDAAEAVNEARRGVTRAEGAVTRAEEAVMRAEKRLQKLLDLEIQYFENPGSDVDGQRLEKLNDLLEKDKEELDKARAVLTERETALKDREAALTEARAALTAAGAELKEAQARLDKVRAGHNISSSSADSRRSRNDTAAGKLLWEELHRNRAAIQHEELSGYNGDPVLEVHEQELVKEAQNERELTTKMKPYIARALEACEYPLRFVNTETQGWLMQSEDAQPHECLRPDGFVTLEGLYKKKGGGLIPYVKLWDMLVVFEAKTDLEDNPDRTLTQGKVIQADCIEWTMTGSREYFLKFIKGGLERTGWVSLILTACRELSANLVSEEAFLGAGRTGRVFKVLQNNETFALKVVRKKDISSLIVEKSQLDACSRVNGLTVKATSILHLDNDAGAAVLITPVGTPMDHATLSEADVTGMFKALFKLHKAGFIHRDARWPNVIKVDGGYRWIDLVGQAAIVYRWMRLQDIQVLRNSILNYDLDVPLESVPFDEEPGSVDLISEDFYDTVAIEVWIKYELQKSDKAPKRKWPFSR
ncbi:hypothetical protein HDU96_009728 [Phlyctochytrium bullatum]|nr:hypothetical protein HDU96_009728 [Phlyctochytrium bullatum]